MPGRRSFLRRAFGAVFGLAAMPAAAKLGGAGGYATGGVLPRGYPRGYQWVGSGPVEMVSLRKPLAYGLCDGLPDYVGAARNVILQIERERLDAMAVSDPCDPWQEAA